MKSTEELAMLRTYLLREYKRLYSLTNDLLNSSDDGAHHDWVYVSGERSAIVRIMGFIGLELPDMSITDEGA